MFSCYTYYSEFIYVTDNYTLVNVYSIHIAMYGCRETGYMRLYVVSYNMQINTYYRQIKIQMKWHFHSVAIKLLVSSLFGFFTDSIV